MPHLLVYSTNSEIDARLIEGKLKSEGFDVRLEYQLGVKTIMPNIFGLYVPEQDLEKAKAIIVTKAILPTKNPSVYLVWFSAAVIVIIIAIVFIFISRKI